MTAGLWMCCDLLRSTPARVSKIQDGSKGYPQLFTQANDHPSKEGEN